MRANSVFSVLAGGSLRWASCAASTAPLWASATSHESAEISGTLGAPGCGRTSVPWRWSRLGCGTAVPGRSGAPGSVPLGAAAATGVRARTPAVHTAQVDAATRDENPIVI